jgi:FkbM family methyltransferase
MVDLNKNDIVDEHNNRIDTSSLEVEEQLLANKYILENDIVLELGARYGSVSCVINGKLKNKKNHVVVEPDSRVWDALERNKKINNCDFFIIKGFISESKLGLTNLDYYHGGYGSTFIENSESDIPSYELSYIKNLYNLEFNTLVADCEGFLEKFLNENSSLYDDLRLIIFEADYPEKCNYDKIKYNLKLNGFSKIIEGHQNVWIKNKTENQK